MTAFSTPPHHTTPTPPLSVRCHSRCSPFCFAAPQAPAMNHRASQKAMNNTFSLSNISPQVRPHTLISHRWHPGTTTITVWCVWVLTVANRYSPMMIPHLPDHQPCWQKKSTWLLYGVCICKVCLDAWCQDLSLTPHLLSTTPHSISHSHLETSTFPTLPFTLPF